MLGFVLHVSPRALRHAETFSLRFALCSATALAHCCFALSLPQAILGRSVVQLAPLAGTGQPHQISSACFRCTSPPTDAARCCGTCSMSGAPWQQGLALQSLCHTPLCMPALCILARAPVQAYGQPMCRSSAMLHDCMLHLSTPKQANTQVACHGFALGPSSLPLCRHACLHAAATARSS